LKKLLLLLVLVIPFWSAQCQNRPFYFKNYQVQNGISSNIITTITQDKKGFMWFGSRNGLNRFDGTTFRIFRNKPTDSTTIGSNSILSLYEDQHEQLWIGTYKGIYIYNALKEVFRPFKLIPPGEVRYIEGDAAGNIWIISDLNLYAYNCNNHRIKQYLLKNDHTITLHLENNGTLWTATARGNINKYQPGQGQTTYHISGANHDRKFSAVQSLYPIGDTALIVGTMNQAVIYNYKTATIRNVFIGHKEINDVHTHAIFREAADEYWLGTESGLYILNLRNGNISHVQKQYNNPYAITDNIISALYKDREGGTWVGTYFGGVNYYSKPYNNFIKYFPQTSVNSLSGNIVHEICKDQYGQLWVGTEDAGLNQIDPKSGFITHYLPEKEKGSISYVNIHGLCPDGDKLWIGTYEHGLDLMDLKTHKVIRHYKASNKAGSFTSDFIVSLYKTRSGDIMVGTWNGLFKYNRKTDDFTALSFFNAPIQSIHEAEDGTLWASSYGGGVYYFNFLTGKKGHITYTAGKKDALINNYVNGIFEDRHHYFWFTTEGGLTRYSPQKGIFKNYTVDNGLPDNQVFRILEDKTGLLWISTAKGITTFNQRTRQFTSYHTANGLPTEQFNYNSSFEDADGTMYFGTVRGMVSFRPAKFALNRFVPPVYITGLQVNNKELKVGAESPLQQSILSTKSLMLSYDNSNLSIDVAALSYMIPEMNRYVYKMDGIDKNWIGLNNNRKIYYTTLPPGKYTFKVKGSNSEGVWNTKETRLLVTILPPFWATWWAYLIYAFIIAGIAVTIFWYYHLAVSEKNKRLIEAIGINTEREIYNAKIEFFTNIAHEIRTPLTLIKMPLDKLLNRDIDDRHLNESLNMIKKNTNRLINLTNQLLDFRKAEANKFSLNFTKADINELLTEVFNDFKSAADQKALIYKLELPRLTLHAFVDNEAFRKILSNLVNNAIKYSSHSVKIRLLPFSSEDVMFNIEVQNDGNPIPSEYHEKIFEPFFRMKETEKESGTGIGLPLSRSLAQLHRGDIQLKASANGMNIFLLSLPFHQETEIDLKSYEPEQPATDDLQQTSLPTHAGNKPLILLVEDNREILNYIQRELSSKYHVLKATNGQEALDLLQKENIQLVISDIMMPIMDGVELCKKMKSDIQYSHVPIILLTAKNSLSSKIEGLEVGADAYIEKPFAFEYLLAQTNSLLSNRNLMKEYFARSPLTHIKGIACSKADKDFLEQLNKTIYDHITDMELDVDKLSALMNMSRPTLYRKIKGLSDLTPNELINLTRLKKAAELLAGGNYKINEVANMIGYSLPSNFSRDFQRQFGVSPSQYVSNLKDGQKQV